LVFQERYRSNSLDSILLADLNNRVTSKAALPNRNSAFEIKVTPQPQQQEQPQEQQPPSQLHHFAKKSPPTAALQGGKLAKRPTFDSLDKRKSWSVDASKMHQQQQQVHLASKG
jgi:hypothetical protein